MSDLTFVLDPEWNLPLFKGRQERYFPLGAWLISEISKRYLVALDALAMLDDATRGDEPDPWDSESYDVAFDHGGLRFANRYALDQRAEYTLDEVRPVLEDYWRFLTTIPEPPGGSREFWPELPRPEADILLWEEMRGRRHPYRGRLF